MLESSEQHKRYASAPLLYAARTDVGSVREENQDSFAVIDGDGYAIFVVADGMGGVRGGSDASSIAVATMRHAFADYRGRPDIQALAAVLERANEDIFAVGSIRGELHGMGTTVVVAAVMGSELLLAHVGDSRAYLLRGGELVRLTTDHTVVQDLLVAGSITEAEAENHPISHVLSRSIGPMPEVDVECARLDHFLKPNDVLLLCSDGLYQMVPQAELVEILSSYDPDHASAKLIARANYYGGTDNITAIVVSVSGAHGSGAVYRQYEAMGEVLGSSTGDLSRLRSERGRGGVYREAKSSKGSSSEVEPLMGSSLMGTAKPSSASFLLRASRWIVALLCGSAVVCGLQGIVGTL